MRTKDIAIKTSILASTDRERGIDIALANHAYINLFVRNSLYVNVIACVLYMFVCVLVFS